jgi:hypothetical protein
VSDAVAVTPSRKLPAKQYLNTIETDWKEAVALNLLLFPLPASRSVRQSKAMPSGRKPVIVRKFSRDWTAGYAGTAFGQDAAELEILDLGGKVLRVGWEQVKWVCYVRDLPGSDAANPERLLHRKFALRPRTAGVWLRMTLTDGDEIEGLAANDRTLLEGAGLMLTPPDTRSNTQRIYVPRQAIQSLEVVGLIGTPKRKAAERVDQPELFPGDGDQAS